MKAHTQKKDKEKAENNKDEESARYSRWDRKLLRALSVINIEPALLMVSIASSLGSVTHNDLLYHQACVVNLNKTAEYCTMNKTRDDDVATVVADIGIWRETINHTLPLIVMLFVGSFSDRYGRKIPALFSISGYIMRFICLLICIFLKSTPAQLVALAYELPPALTGTRSILYIGFYGYISDTTPLADRTLKIGIVYAIGQIGGSCGSALAGLLNKMEYSYFVIFGVFGALEVLAFVYILVVMKNTRPQETVCDKKVKGQDSERSPPQRKMLTDFFNFTNITESFKRFALKREGSGRLQLILLACGIVISSFTNSGEGTVFQQYAYKTGANFKTSDYGFFRTFKQFSSFVGTLCVSILLAKAMNIKDSSLGILASVSQISSSLIFAFADSPWMLYLAAAVDFLSSSASVAGRSMISKLIPSHEIGKILSVIDCIRKVVPLITDPLYAATFRWTLTWFPGLFFLISFVFAVPVLIGFFIFAGKFEPIRVLEAEIEQNQPSFGNNNIIPPIDISTQVNVSE